LAFRKHSAPCPLGSESIVNKWLYVIARSIATWQSWLKKARELYYDRIVEEGLSYPDV